MPGWIAWPIRNRCRRCSTPPKNSCGKARLDRKEIYVFTDLSRGGWPEHEAARLQTRLAELAGLGLYVIDVGIPQPTDYGLGEVRLSGDVLSNRSTLKLETELSCLGTAARRVVELHLLDAQGKPQKRDEQSCDAKPGELQRVEFRVGGLEPGTHQGFVRIVGEDGLAADDTRVLHRGGEAGVARAAGRAKPAETYALFLAEALAPDLYRKRGQARFDCDVCDLDELAKRELAPYAAVCLLDPAPLEPAAWQKLADYAADGHGVAIFLGRNAVPVESFNGPQAQELLPGKLLRQALRPDGDLCLAPPRFSASDLRGLPRPGRLDPLGRLSRLPLLGTRSTGQGRGPSVLPYSDGKPAVLERPVGRGRVLTMTTPVSDRPSRSPWNLLPVGEAWPFVILANQMATYLVGSSDQQLNYLAGQTAVLPLEAGDQRRSYLLFAPGG